MPKAQRFEAEIVDGHKGPAVIAPFDPAKTWGTKPTDVPAPRKTGHLVKGTMNGKPFEGWIGHRWGRAFILVDDALRKQIRAQIGDVISITVTPRPPPRRTKAATPRIAARKNS